MSISGGPGRGPVSGVASPAVKIVGLFCHMNRSVLTHRLLSRLLCAGLAPKELVLQECKDFCCSQFLLFEQFVTQNWPPTAVLQILSGVTGLSCCCRMYAILCMHCLALPLLYACMSMSVWRHWLVLLLLHATCMHDYCCRTCNALLLLSGGSK